MNITVSNPLDSIASPESTEDEIKDKATKVRKKVENNVLRAVSEAANIMRYNMQKKIEDVTADTAKARREYQKEKDTYEALITGVSRPVTEDEYRFLRQFCHPDNHPGNGAKARKAYEVVTRLGERLKFIDARKMAS